LATWPCRSLDIGGDVKRLDRGQLAEAAVFTPLGEAARGIEVGLNGCDGC
jgi:hypothetical protein